MQAAEQAASGARPAEEQGPPRTELAVCHVGLVFAMGMEAGGLVDKLAGVVKTEGAGFIAREGGYAGKRIVLIESGVGQEKAARAAEILIAGHQPRWLISAGFGGGLDPRVKQGDIVVADAIVGETGKRLALDFKMPPTPRVHVGGLLTADRVIHDPVDKRALGERHGVLAVDMETLAVAEACSQAGTRLLSVRVILDEVDHKLPSDIDLLVRKQSTAGKLGAAAGAILRRPSSVKDMWQLKEDALVASDRLAKFLLGMIEQLPRE